MRNMQKKVTNYKEPYIAVHEKFGYETFLKIYIGYDCRIEDNIKVDYWRGKGVAWDKVP